MPKKGWVSFTVRSDIADMIREVARTHVRTPQEQIQAWLAVELGVVKKNG